jgi:hypothetical protein
MRKYTTSQLLRLGVLLTALLAPQSGGASDFQCVLGNKVAASLGDGVTLHSCSWEKTPGNFVRIGPLQLIRNGILILKLNTDSDGKLQGEYRVWDDSGTLTESGYYRDGLKEGEWRLTDANGITRVIVFRAGKPVGP